jgi:hypothetical protein
MTEQSGTPNPPEPPSGGPESAGTPPPPPPPAPPPGAPASVSGVPVAEPLVPGAGPPSPQYAIQLDIGYQDEYSRFLPLIKWLLAIPHFIVLMVLMIGVLFAIFVSWFAVLFTRRYPRGLFNYVVGVLRWSARVNAYVLLQTDKYPPFSLEDDPSYPVRLQVEYPEGGIARWRPLLSWLLVIPYAICAYAIFWLAEVAVFFAFITILFTKKFPRGLFDFVTVGERWMMRETVYRLWMTEKYPPFAFG